MSLATDIMRRRARGFGELVEEGPDYFPQPSWPSGDSGGSADGGSSGPPWWVTSGPLFGVIGKTLSNIFAPYQTSAAQAGVGVYRQPTNYDPNYRQAPNRSVGIGLDSSGIRLSDGSHLGWLPIGAVVFGFFLLQSKGFSRR